MKDFEYHYSAATIHVHCTNICKLRNLSCILCKSSFEIVLSSQLIIWIAIDTAKNYAYAEIKPVSWSSHIHSPYTV